MRNIGISSWNYHPLRLMVALILVKDKFDRKVEQPYNAEKNKEGETMEKQADLEKRAHELMSSGLN